ncbi:MAG TPA: GNAT family N-acetyltransferase [Anaerolineaceae bacterium]|nr:GNAT family N-acetyltransferase [Anaerolineaceae bacterium]
MNFTLHSAFPESLRDQWNDLLAQSSAHVPFLRYEYLHTWWQTLGGGEWGAAETRLAIVTAEQEGALVGIAPLFWARKPEDPAGALYLLGAVEISDYLDLIARPQDLPAFVAGLLPFLVKNTWSESIAGGTGGRSPDPTSCESGACFSNSMVPRSQIPAWGALHLHNLLEDSPSLLPLQAVAGSLGWRAETERLEHCPYIPLPGDWETYLAGIDKKQRHEIRRKMRRAEESGAEVRWYVASDPAALEGEIEDCLRLMANDPEKETFLTPPMKEALRALMRCAFEAGCLHLAFLTINGEKAAMYLSFDYLNRLWIYNSGLDRRFMEYSPGWVLLGNLLQWANEQKRSEFDFMRGDEDYKYRFGAVDRFIVRISLIKG